ncbi:L-lactate permease [Azospirillum sp. TSO22-1]|uniref:L-lactate permease n=1 Tax=Azospirillum sp. TSO22-1 TaxID=716789 RepID=UPI000D61D136|nr:L-lactate permease [Azospirillum sp. TSO22-1]PWC52423.1 lactate permease [Azospirillum sp. TSO22-1]
MALAFHMMPLVGTVALLVSRRVSLLNAGVVGMALALAMLIAVQPTLDAAVDRAVVKAAEGAWLAWHAMSIIAAGLLFHRAFEACPRHTEPASGENRRRAVFVACFLVGPFAESVTGFGVGLVVALAMLRHMGLPPVHAAALGLFSQILAPWGAMGVGTRVGAELIGASFAELGTASALLMGIVLPCLLPVFWRLIHQSGLTSTLADRVTDVALAVCLAVLIWATNRFVAPELGGGLATGVLLLLVEGPRLIRSAGDVQRLLRQLWPYTALVGGLLATRLVPPLSDWTGNWLVLDPFGGLAPLALLRHPATWLVLVAAILLAGLPGRRARQVAGGALRAAVVPMLATLVFVELATFMSASGGAALFGRAWQDAAGHLAVLATPIFGAAAGALTGSNTASNALMMHIQLSLAAESGLSPMLTAALQTVSGSICTMLAPGRIVLAAGLVGLVKAEGAIYRLALPIGLVSVLSLLAVVVAVVGLRGWGLA